MMKIYTIIIMLFFVCCIPLYSNDYLFTIKKSAFEFPNHDIPEANLPINQYFEDEYFLIINGTHYSPAKVLTPKAHTKAQSALEALENFLHWGQNGDTTDFSSQYDQASLAFISAQPADIKAKVSEGIKLIKGFDVDFIIPQSGSSIVLARQDMDSIITYYIPWQCTEENDTCKLKAGELQVVELGVYLAAINSDLEHGLTESFSKVTVNGAHVENAAAGQSLSFSAATTVPPISKFNWTLDDNILSSTDAPNASLTMEKLGVHKVQAFTNEIQASFPSKINVIGIESVSGESGSGLFETEVAVSIGTAVNFSAVSTLKNEDAVNIWPVGYPTWTGPGITGQGDQVTFQMNDPGEYEVSVNCGTSSNTIYISVL